MLSEKTIKKALKDTVIPDGTDMEETMYALGWYDALNFVLNTKDWQKTQEFFKFKLLCQREAEKQS